MKKIFFTEDQIRLVQRAICSFSVYLANEYLAIQKGEESEELELCYERNAKYEVDKILLKGMVEANILTKLQILKSIVKSKVEPDQEFHIFSFEQLEMIDIALCVYLWGKLDCFICELSVYPNENNLIFRWLPELSHKSMVGLFPGFIENQKDVSFFEDELNEGYELWDYIQGQYSNKMYRSDFERIEAYLDEVMVFFC